MTVSEIKKAIEEGKKVFWCNELYKVIKDTKGQYLIKCNDHCIGLTYNDGVTLNGKEEQFFIK